MLSGTSLWKRSSKSNIDQRQLYDHESRSEGIRTATPDSQALRGARPTCRQLDDLSSMESHQRARSSDFGHKTTLWRSSSQPTEESLRSDTVRSNGGGTPTLNRESPQYSPPSERPRPPSRTQSASFSKRYSLNTSSFLSIGSSTPTTVENSPESSFQRESSPPKSKRSSLSLSLKPVADIFSTGHRRRPSLQSGSTGVPTGNSPRPGSAQLRSSRSRASSAAANNNNGNSSSGRSGKLSLSTSSSALGDASQYNNGPSSREIVDRVFQNHYHGFSNVGSGGRDLPDESPIDPMLSKQQMPSRRILENYAEMSPEDGQQIGGQSRMRSSTSNSNRSQPSSATRKASLPQNSTTKARPNQVNTLDNGRDEYPSIASQTNQATPESHRSAMKRTDKSSRNNAAYNESSDDDSSSLASYLLSHNQSRRPSQVSLSGQSAQGHSSAAQRKPSLAGLASSSSSSAYASRPLSAPRTRDREPSSSTSRPSTSSTRLQSADANTEHTPPNAFSRVSSLTNTAAAASDTNGTLRSSQRSTSSTAVNSSKERSGSRSSSSQYRSRSVTVASSARLKNTGVVRTSQPRGPISPPKVDPAPASGMYWHRLETFGVELPALRAHSTTIVNNLMYIFGGCDSTGCYNDLYIFDPDSLTTIKPTLSGDIPPPLRAHTATAIQSRKIVIFGGGNGPKYYTNDLYVLDIMSLRFTKVQWPEGAELPERRRAHTACLYKNGVYIFGGGDGQRALNDVWRLDVSDPANMSWKCISKSENSPKKPTARGYHSANMVNSKLIIYGGSDGVVCFDDVWILDVEEGVWSLVICPERQPERPLPLRVRPEEVENEIKSVRRLSHTATLVGSYLFIVGGHDGKEYSNDVVVLDLGACTDI